MRLDAKPRRASFNKQELEASAAAAALQKDHEKPPSAVPQAGGIQRRFHGSKAAAEFLDEHGYPISSATLDTMVSRGGGPPYRKWGKYRLYEESDLLEWAEARAGEKISSSSEVA